MQLLDIDIDIEKVAYSFYSVLFFPQIYASSYLTALYLKQFAPTVKKVYVIGKYGIVEELKLQGFEVLWAQDHKELSMEAKEFANLETDDDIGAVVRFYLFGEI